MLFRSPFFDTILPPVNWNPPENHKANRARLQRVRSSQEPKSKRRVGVKGDTDSFTPFQVFLEPRESRAPFSSSHLSVHTPGLRTKRTPEVPIININVGIAFGTGSLEYFLLRRRATRTSPIKQIMVRMASIGENPCSPLWL